MEYNKFISDMNTGEEIEGFYILKDAALKTTSAGKPFLSASISDKTGSMEIKVWDYSGPVGNADAGKVIKLRGEVSEFKGSPQITVSRIRLANDDDRFSASSLVPTAPIDTEESFSEVLEAVKSIEDDDYRKICETMLGRHRENFRNIPAAKSVHHAFLSGLLMHTLNMLRSADFLADLYSEVIDRSLLLAGTLLHDMAKEREFVFSELGIATDYSIKGQLLGHLVMGAEEVSRTASELGTPENKSILLQHMILSHHGEPEHGAAVRPLCAEAELLSYIDLIDSRMEIYAETFQDVPVGSFSGRVFSLEKRIFNHE